MKKRLVQTIGLALVLAVWVSLTLGLWFLPAKEISDSERRKLAQFPELNAKTLLDGSFMTKFETYTLDQFPMRDGFRQLKARFVYDVLLQKDHNDIYLADGYAAKLEYPLNRSSLDYACERLNAVYDRYLADTQCRCFAAVVPDKAYFLSAPNGYPVMDYEALFAQMERELPWAKHIDLTDSLTLEDYYRTDTHWRQERLIPAAGKLANALDIPAPALSDYTVTTVDKPFYGVYYGQAALPMEAETICLLENEMLSHCGVYNVETDTLANVYDRTKLDSRDLYDLYLSGAASVLEINNPDADTDRELVVFRDSYGSSITPLLVQGYRKVTLVDIRYIRSDLVGDYVNFKDQDVLFLYSTLILNSSASLK